METMPTFYLLLLIHRHPLRLFGYCKAGNTTLGDGSPGDNDQDDGSVHPDEWGELAIAITVYR
jgi:hypothetical protein